MEFNSRLSRSHAAVVWLCSREGVLVGSLAALCLTVYLPALGGVFLSWDDTQHLLLNPWLTRGEAAHFWSEPYYGMYIPLTYTVWTVLFQLWPSPSAFHLLNLALHAANTWFVYCLAQYFAPRAGKRGALAAALLFAVHPLQVESVAWIASGRDLLSAFFGLASALASLALPALTGTLLALVLFAGSLLCKPNLLLLPISLWAASRLSRGELIFRRAVLLGMCLLSTFAGVIAVAMQARWAGARLANLSVGDRFLAAADALGFYLGKFVLPAGLAADYGRTPMRVVQEGLFVWPIAALAGVTFLLIAFRKSRSGAVAGGLAFFTLLLTPVVGLVPFSAQTISTVFDHFAYFPLVGLVCAVGALCTDDRGFHVVLLAAIVFAGLSFDRSFVWRTNRALAEDMVARNPRSYNGLNNLALVEIEGKRLDSALPLLRRARELDPESAVAWSNLAYVYWLHSDLLSIVREVYPLLFRSEFRERNANEPQAVALMFRMSARALFSLRREGEAHGAYCNARMLDPWDADLESEARAHMGGKGCEVVKKLESQHAVTGEGDAGKRE